MGSVLGFPSINPADAVIGARLRRWRDQRRIEPDALAQALSVTPEALRGIENGRIRLTSAQMAAATASMHLPLWALVSDTRAY